MGGQHLGLDGQRTIVTVAEERIFHYIADEELEMLINGENEPMAQVFWAAFGVFFGSLQPAIVGAAKVGDPSLGWIDLIPIFIVAAAAPVAAVAGISWRVRSRRVKSMQQRIRERPKVLVRSMVTIDYVPE